ARVGGSPDIQAQLFTDHYKKPQSKDWGFFHALNLKLHSALARVGGSPDIQAQLFTDHCKKP
ncbi:hypothetical protein, partial [Vibrio metschnikovii]|uniref:hypothetical protein n=1 Tax=Vibrio metschnikovii TaxID=28172 RepID=UPI002FC5EA18